VLSYRHEFHAGNFADVMKHICLIQLIKALTNKPAGFCYIDSHSGSNYYDLTHEFAQKTSEFKSGIELLWSFYSLESPNAVKDYLQLIANVNNKTLTTYLGSAALIKNYLRPQDQMILMELHPQSYHILKSQFQANSQIHLHQRDGFQGIIALTPPIQKRGLIFIDPAYELKTDYITAIDTIKMAYKKWSNAIYVLWYPIFAQANYSEILLKQCNRSSLKKVLRIELTRQPSHTPRALIGSGLLIVNPPYLFEQQLQQWLPWLWSILSPHSEGEWRIEWLIGE
jgi:23S rRNA (adenine2030-N6)-methyltransferase